MEEDEPGADSIGQDEGDEANGYISMAVSSATCGHLSNWQTRPRLGFGCKDATTRAFGLVRLERMNECLGVAALLPLLSLTYLRIHYLQHMHMHIHVGSAATSGPKFYGLYIMTRQIRGEDGQSKQAIHHEDFGRGLVGLACLGLPSLSMSMSLTSIHTDMHTYVQTGEGWPPYSPFQSRMIPRVEVGFLLYRRRAPSWLRDAMQGDR